MKKRGVVAPPTGDRPLSPVGGATAPLFFLQGLRCEFEEKKITLWACRPMGGRPGYIFEIFKNGHIFFEILILKKKYKNEKTATHH